MPNPENLNPPWKKGQSGNPNGRPKLPDLKAALAKYLSEEKEGKTALDAVLAKLRQMAANGNLKAAEMLLDRAYGKPTQQVNSTVTIEKPIFTGIDLTSEEKE